MSEIPKSDQSFNEEIAAELNAAVRVLKGYIDGEVEGPVLAEFVPDEEGGGTVYVSETEESPSTPDTPAPRGGTTLT